LRARELADDAWRPLNCAARIGDGGFTSWSGNRLSALGDLKGPTDASDLHGGQPSFPHGRIDRRSVDPFQACHDEGDLLVRLRSLPRCKVGENQKPDSLGELMHAQPVHHTCAASAPTAM